MRLNINYMKVCDFDTRPVAMPIKRILQENEHTWTFVFEYRLESKPGQFVMLWIPGVDEKPFSIAYDDGEEFWLTVCKVGPATEKLFEMYEGDMVGIRGPFGTSYEFYEGESLVTVAGGYGAAPMYYVTLEAIKKGCEVDFITGAKAADLVLFEEKVGDLKGVTLHVATDDGSKGFKGFTTELLEQILAGKTVDRVFTCGPELMMKRVGEVASVFGVPCFMSVEKYMKCGFGICGNCSIDHTGDLVCMKGPVMEFAYVKDLREFGNYHRDAQGKKHYYKGLK